MPGAFPVSANDFSKFGSADVANEVEYDPGYADEQQHHRHSIHSTTLLIPSGPSATLPPTNTGLARHVSTRSSMPNLAHQQGKQDIYRPHETPGAFTAEAEWEHAGHGPRGSPANRSSPSYLPRELYGGQNYSETPYQIQTVPLPCPPPPPEVYPQQPFHGYCDTGALIPTPRCRSALPLPKPGYRHSVATTDASQQSHPVRGPQHYSELSLENLAKHNRSQGALDSPEPRAGQGLTHNRSRSQVDMRPKGAPVFNPYDYQQQPLPQQQPPLPQQPPLQPQPPLQQQPPKQQLPQPKVYPATVSRKSMGPRAPPNFNIVIPQPKGRPQSTATTRSENQGSSRESSPISNPASASRRRPRSPQTIGTADSSTVTTPISAVTSMSDASAVGTRDVLTKRITSSNPFTRTPTISVRTTPARTMTVRKSSTATNRTSMSGSTTSPPDNTVDTPTSEDSSDEIEVPITYTAKKPKATLIRAFRQILNPKKVAEKDALRIKNEHSAWVEMQKSLKRVGSPEPGTERPFFLPPTLPADGIVEDSQLDPFELLKKCQVLRDAHSGPGVANGAIDFGPNTFMQVDKVARNVNQRGNHLTPQLLSQKYLTRPYSKSPLSKLRVLFVWVSENIRLEGGPTRDVTGGRYKLGPASEQLTALTVGANGGAFAVGESPSLRAANSPASKFMAGLDEYARGFLREDAPEQAQGVLTSRTCKTGEGYANLFAEMAIAAGIEDVGVVKGYIKGPMDVFAKDVPPPNHAWNVVRIDGTYRFIDCCLASPSHPAHYPKRPQVASSFYFLTSPMDLVMTHAPVFLTYQYITPSIPPQIFLQLPYVRPAFFEYGLSLPDFKRRTKLDIKDEEPIEVVMRIDGGGQGSNGPVSGLFGGECSGRGCGEGIELRAEVEVMTTEGKIIRKRALAQVMIVNPYQNLAPGAAEKHSPVHHHLQAPHGVGSMISVASSSHSHGSSIAAASNRSYQAHHCSGIRIAKIKAVLPPETVVGPGGVRKGVVHIYAGRKVENVSGTLFDGVIAYTVASLAISHVINTFIVTFLGTKRREPILVGPDSSYSSHGHDAKDVLQLCTSTLFALRVLHQGSTVQDAVRSEHVQVQYPFSCSSSTGYGSI